MLTSCPQRAIGRDIIDVIDYAALYEKGIPPVAGGALDQAYSFTEACRQLWADQARLKPTPSIFEL